MKSARLTELLVAVVLVGLVAAIATGTHLSRVHARQHAQATAQHDLAISTWPRPFVRVPNVSRNCDAAAPSICLHTTDGTKLAAAKIAQTVSTPSVTRQPTPGAPDSYVVRGTIGNDRAEVLATVRPRVVGPSKTTQAPVLDGSDVTIGLLASAA